MDIAGLTMNDTWAGRVLSDRGVQLQHFEQVRCDIGVLVDAVHLQHHGAEKQYRPYLHLTGELRSISPEQGEVRLPYGITQVTYSPEHGEKVDGFYEFTDEQLSVLLAKGYFRQGFAVPEKIVDTQWYLPTTTDFMVLEPSSEVDGDVPVVFTTVHNLSALELTEHNSGYDLTEYFDDDVVLAQVRASKQQAVTKSADVTVVHEVEGLPSLFSEEQMAGENTTLEATQESRASAQAGLASRLAEADALIRSEEADHEAALEAIEGTPENLYAHQVAPALADEDSARDDEAVPGDTKARFGQGPDGSDDPDVTGGSRDETSPGLAVSQPEPVTRHVPRHGVREYVENVEDSDEPVVDHGPSL